MRTQAPNPNPEGVSAVWRAVHKLEKDFAELLDRIPQSSLWSKAWSWVWHERNWAIPTILAILAGLGSGAYYTGGLLLDRHVQSAIGPLQADVKRIDGDLREIKGTLSSIQLRQLSNTPSSPQSIKEAKTILNTARANGLKISNEAVADSGTKFVEASSANPAAWNTVLEFLQYRTYLNTITVPLGEQVVLPEPLSSRYSFSKENVPQQPTLSSIGLSKSGDAAELRNLPAPDLNKAAPAGPSILVLNTPTVILDNLYAKKVIFENSHIIYRGGPVLLDNVYFLNCTFEIENQTRGQELARNILAGPVTNFMSS